MDILDVSLAKSGAKAYTDAKVATLGNGFTYKGSVETASELPSSATLGDMYTVSGDYNRQYVYTGTEWAAREQFLPLSGGTVTGELTVNDGVVANVTGNVTGNLTGTASKATADANGNNIASTYLTTTGTAAKATADADGNNIASTYLTTTGTAAKATADASGNVITTTYAKADTVLEQSKRLRNVMVAMGYEDGKEWTVSDLSTAVQGGDLDEIALGDYFKVSFTTDYGTVTNKKCLVAGINYFLNCGDTATTTPHLVMIPESTFGSAAMNSTNTTVGGYVGSAMHTTVLPAIASALKSAIGSSHVIAQRRLLSNTMTSSTASMAGAGLTGAETNSAWTDCELCLMNEPMVFGGMFNGSSFYAVGDRNQQLPIFSLNPQIAHIRSYWWLSDVCSASLFADVARNGNVVCDGAGSANGVRPFFCFH